MVNELPPLHDHQGVHGLWSVYVCVDGVTHQTGVGQLTTVTGLTERLQTWAEKEYIIDLLIGSKMIDVDNQDKRVDNSVVPLR